MFYYTLENKILISPHPYTGLEEISEDVAQSYGDNIFVLQKKDPHQSRRSFSISDPSLFFLQEEGIDLLQKESNTHDLLPLWIREKIKSKQVTALNTAYPKWKEVLNYTPPKKWRVHIVGLGDVGGILLTGLRLLGGDKISKLGIYNKDENSTKRWEYEVNQILSPDNNQKFPSVSPISEEEIFDCDMFVFCASVGVPPVGKEGKDVRIVQFQGNRRIVEIYAKMARKHGFKGIFAVVSDPVDLLCKAAFLSSNRDENENMDFGGLAPEQIRGYGLGVMHARAVYFSKENPKMVHYSDEGRAYGPHGEGLIIADSIDHYNHELSIELTDKARRANLDVRSTGFKPYIAPALSSGTLSILATIEGSWHYSATFMGGVFLGAKNRLLPSGTEIERLVLPNKLLDRIKNTYERLWNTL